VLLGGFASESELHLQTGQAPPGNDRERAPVRGQRAEPVEARKEGKAAYLLVAERDIKVIIGGAVSACGEGAGLWRGGWEKGQARLGRVLAVFVVANADRVLERVLFERGGVRVAVKLGVAELQTYRDRALNVCRTAGHADEAGGSVR
jgi:hypothetical protein